MASPTSAGPTRKDAALNAITVLHQALSELQLVLRTEHDLLADPAASGLDTLGARKQAALRAVEHAEIARRDAVLHAAPQSTDNAQDALEQLLATTVSTDPLRTRWEAVLAAAEHCRLQNLRNGALLGLRKRHTDKLLAALRGTSNHSVYAASGYLADGGAAGTRSLTA